METLNTLIARNRSWAKQQKRRNSRYFLNHISGQKPVALWIGCSDSRVPAEVITGAHPGELFVHRNIANMVLAEDDSLMSVLEYALCDLQISTIVLCGHYGCGGVKATTTLCPKRHTQEQPALFRRLISLKKSLNDYSSGEKETEDNCLNKIIEYNVLTQVSHLMNCLPVRQAYTSGIKLDIHGCVYDLHSGHLKQLIHHERERG